MKLRNDYYEGRLTKYDLAANLTGESKDREEQPIREVLQLAEQAISGPLLNTLDAQKTLLVSDIKNTLGKLATISGYFAGRPNIQKMLEQDARNMKIWRQPQPNLENPQVARRSSII